MFRVRPEVFWAEWPTYDSGMARRLAVFGGTFDPPHVGHLVVASDVRHLGGFDEVLLMVANDPWQKSAGRTVTPADVRFEMVAAAVAGHEGLVASDLEIGRGGPTYTIETVEAMTAVDDGIEVSLVLGADAVAGLDSWHRAGELADLVQIVAVGRPGHAAPSAKSSWRLRTIDVPALDVSSTDLRARCAAGAPIDFLVPDAVRSVIAERGLYGVRR